MPCVHEFRILDDFDKQKDYIEYESQEYHCICVDDDIINCLLEQLSIMKTYFHSFHRPEYGLSNCGITIIPTTSLSLFYDVVTSSMYFAKYAELQELASIIIQAIKGNKYIIHFGI